MRFSDIGHPAARLAFWPYLEPVSRMIKRSLPALLMLLLPLAAQAVPFWGAQQSRPAETAPGDLKPGE